MARQGLRRGGLIAMVAALFWTGFMVIDLSSAEARMGGFGGARGGGFGGMGSGFRGGFSSGFHGGFSHGTGFTSPVVVSRSVVSPVVVNRAIVTNRVIVTDRFFVPFHRNVFFFNVGFGGFFPVAYPYPYPYPVYYPPYPPVYQYSQYSPCGYYDPNGVWINAPCPQYAPPTPAPSQGTAPEGVSAPTAEPSSDGTTGPQSPGY